MTAIKAENLSFSYRSEGEIAEVFDKLNIEIDSGEFVSVLGRNGSGKSTFAKQLNAILIPDKGRVTVFGIDTSNEETVFELRKNVGMVFQNPDNQIVATVVEEDVAFGPENLGVPYEELRRRVDEALKTVRMYDYRRHAPHLLSGGQKQRVAIAGILAMEPKCIVLDEPTAMLDPIGRDEVMETVRRLNREKGITIILVTHYMDEAVKTDRCIVMDKGRVVMDDTPANIFPRVEELRAIGLDVPQATELAYELKKRGIDIGGGILRSKPCIKAIAELYNNRKKAENDLGRA